MAIYDQSVEKRKILQDFRRHEEEVIGSLCRLSNRPLSPKAQMEQEKKIRREIANSNERRRMQSINAGFQSLKSLLPHHEGEKLSKAAILQQTVEYIYQLEQEKTRLLTQNCQLKRLVNNQYGHDSDGGSSADSPLPKRKKIETAESSDEGIGNMSPYEGNNGSDDTKREMIDLRIQLDRERRLRLKLEEQNRNMEAQMYPDRIREIAHQVQMQYDESKSGEDVSPQDGGQMKLITSDPTMLSTMIDSSSSCPDSDEPQDLSTSPDDRKNRCSPPLSLSVTNSTSSNLHQSSQIASNIEDVVNTSTTSVTIPVKDERQSHSPTLKTMLSQNSQLEIDIPSTAERLYPASTSRQNLETIVEAIRHLEGDHLFQDDPKPSKQSSTEHNNYSSEELSSYRHAIIQCSPVNAQSRPGVIVATHS